MATKSKQIQPSVLEIDTQAVGFMLGKGRKNINAVIDKYKSAGGVNIRVVPNGITTKIIITATNTAIQDACNLELDMLREKALITLSTVQFRNRLEKEKEEKRRSILAANRIRESIENEMKARHREDIIKKLSADIAITGEVADPDEEEPLYIHKNNKFAGLDLEMD